MPKRVTHLKQYGVRVNGVLIRKSFGSATEARKWQRSQKKVQDEIRSGSKRHMEPTLLSVHAVDFLRSRKDMTSYQHQVTWMGKYILMRPKFRDKYLHELTKGNWKEVFGPTGELIVKYKLAPGTHNRVRAMVSKMYEDARKEHEPSRALDNPIKDIPELEEPKKMAQFIGSKKDIGEYLKAAYEDRLLPCWGIYSMIKLNTGLRQQNIIPFRWKDWDASRSTLHVREKYTRRGFKPGSKSNSDERLVGVNPALAAALKAWHKVTPFKTAEDFIVATPRGEHITVHKLWDANDRTMKAAGIPYMSEHKLRHTYATHYLDGGGNIHDLKLNMFHSTITTTELYSHALKSQLAQRASVMQVSMPGKKSNT